MIYIIYNNYETFYYDAIRVELTSPSASLRKSASTLSDMLLRTQTQYSPSEFANIHSRSCASTFEETDTPRD
jgi:hypothetical protein